MTLQVRILKNPLWKWKWKSSFWKQSQSPAFLLPGHCQVATKGRFSKIYWSPVPGAGPCVGSLFASCVPGRCLGFLLSNGGVSGPPGDSEEEVNWCCKPKAVVGWAREALGEACALKETCWVCTLLPELPQAPSFIGSTYGINSTEGISKGDKVGLEGSAQLWEGLWK